MDTNEIILEQEERINYLNTILSTYRGSERKSKKVLSAIVVVVAVAIYFLLFDLLGGIWGYIVTVAILGIGVYCADKAGLSFNFTATDGKLAYQACVTMEVLVKIKEGTYRTDIANILTTGTGKHIDLYKKFIRLYPEYASKELEKLAKTEVELKDMYE